MTPEQPLKAAVKRRLPIGAEIISGQGVHFRLWAPRRSSLCVALEGGPGCPDPSHPALTSLENEGNGYFSGLVPSAASGTLYRFRCDDDAQPYPDPASRFQPDGPLGPSQVIDPSRFKWTDGDWPGAKLQGQVIYEMHIGTFTREGTWNAALPCLKRLAEIGITLIEVMPVADFGGQFNWGYDGTDLYAPTRVYGTPDDFRRFVDHAHGLGLGVILDVVYNHLGPIGNFLRCFSLDYFTDQYETDWGEAINFDGKNSGPVREFFITNAGYWIDEFHLDGLRIDATDQIYDTSCEQVLSHIVSHARQCAGGRSILLIGENESQRVKLLRPPPEGYGLDALWSDDFHHTAIVALQGHNEAYYADYLGTAQELISTAKWAYLYQGQFYSWQEKRRGTPTFGFKPERFVHYLQNHDQVANSPRGDRFHVLTSPGRARAMTTFLLLSPQTPLLFQGQEFCASNRFCFFADVGEELGKLVRKGRIEFLSQFRSIKDAKIQAEVPDPTDRRTFDGCKLDQGEIERNRECYALYRDLLRLRRRDDVFRAQRTDWLHGAVLGPEAFVLRYLGGEFGDRLLLFNFGRDLKLVEAPEPLLACPEDSLWDILWSSESPRYGGSGTPEIETEECWIIPGHAAVVMAPKKIVTMYKSE